MFLYFTKKQGKTPIFQIQTFIKTQPTIALSKHGSNLQQPDWFFARNQSNRTIFDPPNKPGWIYKRLLNQAIRNGSEFTSTIPPHSN